MAPQQPMKHQLRTFYVYDPAVTNLGGVVAKAQGDDRVVVMSQQQAQYWIDQGVIGVKPLHKLESKTRSTLNQMAGGRIGEHAKSKTEYVDTEPEVKTKKVNLKG